MAKSKDTTGIEKQINDLRAERSELAARLAEIDEFFQRAGITVEDTPAAPAKRGPGRPKGSKSTKKTSKKKAAKTDGRRRRGKFGRSGDESILDFVKQKGEPTTAEINEHWQGEGRGGKADNSLTKLVSAGKLKRKKIPGERGSRYAVA